MAAVVEKLFASYEAMKPKSEILLVKPLIIEYSRRKKWPTGWAAE